MKKQTAGNNKLLAHVKAKYNKLIFAKVSEVLNSNWPTIEQRESIAIDYLCTLVRPEVREDRKAYLRSVAAGVIDA